MISLRALEHAAPSVPIQERGQNETAPEYCLVNMVAMQNTNNLVKSFVSVTPSTTVRVGGNVVGGLHDICVGGERTNLESGRAGSCAGVARTS